MSSRQLTLIRPFGPPPGLRPAQALPPEGEGDALSPQGVRQDALLDMGEGSREAAE